MRTVWVRSARRHRVGRGSAQHVVRTAVPVVHHVPGRDPQLWWVGPDERGRVLEVMAVWQEELLMFVHVMPVALRERKNR
ncbi:hypothetical protein [Kineococcus terrestris]|uniref:hypothetical protein n=1 Tax=Kineococcus terrestris TaxID=2044856 RepID=UPI0034DAC559